MTALTPQQRHLLQRLAAARERAFNDFVSITGGDKVTLRALLRAGLAVRACRGYGARITDQGLAALAEAP